MTMMQATRMIAGKGPAPEAPCSRCQAVGCPWDRIGDKPVCPDCQENLVLGEGPPVVERVESHSCAICGYSGTLRYVTFPLRGQRPVEIDLCSRHFEDLLGRRLDGNALRHLGRQLEMLGLSTRQLFLLHEAFYDDQGHPLQPLPEAC